MMTFNDIIKTGALKNYSEFSIFNTVLALAIALCLGLFIMWVYKKTFKGVIYSKGFSLSLLCMTLITTLIILAITSNVVLSLGMVGALSIVRFRTAIKEPMDIAFLFLAICTGIVSGAGLFILAIVGVLFISVVLMLFSNSKSEDQPYILVMNCENRQSEATALSYIGGAVGKHVVKSKSVNTNGSELTIEVKIKNNDTDFLTDLSALDGVGNVVLVSYNGDYMA